MAYRRRKAQLLFLRSPRWKIKQIKSAGPMIRPKNCSKHQVNKSGPKTQYSMPIHQDQKKVQYSMPNHQDQNKVQYSKPKHSRRQNLVTPARIELAT